MVDVIQLSAIIHAVHAVGLSTDRKKIGPIILDTTLNGPSLPSGQLLQVLSDTLMKPFLLKWPAV